METINCPECLMTPCECRDDQTRTERELQASQSRERELLFALKRCVPWLGKMIADGGHLQAVAPNDAVLSLARAEQLIAKIEASR
jgi:hypothetical protein